MMVAAAGTRRWQRRELVRCLPPSLLWLGGLGSLAAPAASVAQAVIKPAGGTADPLTGKSGQRSWVALSQIVAATPKADGAKVDRWLATLVRHQPPGSAARQLATQAGPLVAVCAAACGVFATELRVAGIHYWHHNGGYQGLLGEAGAWYPGLASGSPEVSACAGFGHGAQALLGQPLALAWQPAVGLHTFDAVTQRVVVLSLAGREQWSYSASHWRMPLAPRLRHMVVGVDGFSFAFDEANHYLLALPHDDRGIWAYQWPATTFREHT